MRWIAGMNNSGNSLYGYKNSSNSKCSILNSIFYDKNKEAF